MMRTAGQTQPEKQRKKKKVLRVAIVLVGGVTLLSIALAGLALYAGSLATSDPDWWESSASAQIAEAPDRARRLEQGITTALSAEREEDEPWSVRMSDDDANAWLEHRLGQWLENRSVDTPDNFEPPRVHIENGRASVGIASPDPRFPGIFSIEFTPEITDAGELIVTDRSFRLGKLPLPSPQALSRISNSIKGQARDRKSVV